MLNENIQQIYFYLDFQSIVINKEEFKFQIETHPDYPSLIAFSDGLSFFNIPNIVIKLPFENVDNLENSFVVLLQKKTFHQLYIILQKKEIFIY